jgi:hypothetical protein
MSWRTGDAYVDGLFVAGNEKYEIIQASVQRLTMAERQRLPEGFRTHDSYKLYTEAAAIQTLLNNRLNDAAQFEYRGQRFSMLSWERWDFVIPHWKITMVGKNG